jgi:hypothetical protein
MPRQETSTTFDLPLTCAANLYRQHQPTYQISGAANRVEADYTVGHWVIRLTLLRHTCTEWTDWNGEGAV